MLNIYRVIFWVSKHFKNVRILGCKLVINMYKISLVSGVGGLMQIIQWWCQNSQWWVFCVHCTVYTVQYTPYSAHYAVHTIQRSLYSIHFMTNNVQCTP